MPQIRPITDLRNTNAISEAEEEYEAAGIRLDARETLAGLRRDLDDIYNHMADDFKEIGTAQKMADSLENAILSLDEMPYRGSIRRTGAFASRGYRQYFVL